MERMSTLTSFSFFSALCIQPRCLECLLQTSQRQRVKDLPLHHSLMQGTVTVTFQAPIAGLFARFILLVIKLGLGSAIWWVDYFLAWWPLQKVSMSIGSFLCVFGIWDSYKGDDF
ncbi:hypothetical protein Ancab_026914 [Ancistrocladus abbreviatus]